MTTFENLPQTVDELKDSLRRLEVLLTEQQVPTMLPPDEIWDVKRAAAELGIAENTVRDKAKIGKLPGTKSMGVWHFVKSEVVEALKTKKQKI